jgi:hypothetical protein
MANDTGKQHTTDAEITEALWALERVDGNQTKAASMLGISRATLMRRAGMADDRALSPPQTAPPIVPDFPPDDIPIEEIIENQCARFEKRAKSYAAHTWFRVGMREDVPIGVLWFGDPHVDDNGCNWPVLRRHTEICSSTPGLYGANIGDTTNNWAGRLIKLYADQDVSLKTARKLAYWFMAGSGITWLLWLLGNHDQWGDGSAILSQMGQSGPQIVTCHDWEARFKICFPGGWEPRVYSAHDFKGHSQWNPMHGPMKEAQMGEFADLYVAGHKHNWAIFNWENAGRDNARQTFIRVRGYKFHDKYARDHGFKQQQDGCSILTVFDPGSKTITPFEDVEVGADFLTFLRKRAGA